MNLQNIKVLVQTSTNVKFITSIPLSLTIKQTLPVLLKKYLAVVRQNYDEVDQEELAKVKNIKQITKNGFLVPLDEQVINILNDNDTLFINLSTQDKHQKEANLSKKQKLQSKKEQKIKQIAKLKSNEQQKDKQKTEKQSINIDKLLLKYKNEITNAQAKKESKPPKSIAIQQESSS